MQKLSEQLAFGDLVAFTSAGSLTASTGGAIDMSKNHRMVVLAVASTVSVTGTATAAGTTTVPDSVATATATASLTFSVVVQASTSTGFGAPTTVTSSTISRTATATATATSTGGTVTTATATASLEAGAEVDIWGEDVQAARAAEDRYVRAVVSISALSGVPAIALASVQKDQSRYKPTA